MIKKIGIENFRIFKDYTEFELAPITVLTGTNNSGKSSFLKMMNLLQQSVKDLSSLNVLNFDNGNHNLGSFENTITWDSDKDVITIVFDFPLDYFDEDFKLELVYSEMGEVGYLKSYKIFNKHRDLLVIDDIELETGNYKTFINTEHTYEYLFSFDLEYIKKFIFQEKTKNGTISENLKNKPKDFLFYTYTLKVKEEEINLNERVNNKPESLKDLIDDLLFIESHAVPHKSSIDNCQLKNENSDLFTGCFEENEDPLRFWKENYTIGKDLSEYFKNDLFKNDGEYNLFDENVELSIEPENLKLFKKLVINNIQNSLDKLKYSLENVDFISASRGSKKRFLEDSSSNDLDEIVKEFIQLDLMGDNFTYNDSGKRIYIDNENNKFLKKALKLLNIKGELSIERIEGVVSIIYLKQKDKKTNIADLGYGYSQVIPMLLKIVLSAQLNKTNNSTITDKAINESPSFGSYIDGLKPTLVIEEPEANLHPKLQSKLADVFVLAYKTFGIHFILETHSEYLIRKLQYLTAKNEITQDDAVIYYFNADEYVNAKEPKVKEIKIDEFGGLSDTFGPGFYDEATNLKFDLMKLNKAQNN